MIIGRIPTEAMEQEKLCQWLRYSRLIFHHSANEGKHKVQYRAKMARQGMSKGFPDIIVITRPPLMPEARGVALELKRVKGGKTSPEQTKWLEDMRSEGWFAAVALGADHAIEILEGLGYGKR